jgi:hypothetical protein
VRSDRIEALARDLAVRESPRVPAREEARRLADLLRRDMVEAARSFAKAAGAAGAPHLDLIRVGEVEPDDKSIRAFQFRVARGRFEAVVVSKDRGEVMLVGPFKRGQAETPCHAVHLDAPEAETLGLDDALEGLLVSLIQESFES